MPDYFGEEVRAAGRTTGEKAFAPGCTMCKKVLAAPQARGLLLHLRRDGFVAAQWANIIVAAPDESISPSHR